MFTELGERIGQVETLVRLFPDHEARVNGALDSFSSRLSALSEELLGRHNALEAAFTAHRHDAPAPLVQELERADPAELLDSPITSIDNAIDEVIPTPAAPAAPEVQAPVALRRTTVYRSHLHRHR